MYHISHLLQKQGKKVLMADLDSQCNLSAYSISDSELEKSWKPKRGNSIWNAVERVYSGLGDIRNRKPTRVNEKYQNLFLIPGDTLLSDFEDKLGDTWNSAKGGNEPALRVQSALYRYIIWAADVTKADIVMVDLGPNLGALNRTLLTASDYFILPMSPDLFSIRGTENLGLKLVLWRKDWDQCNNAWNQNKARSETFLPLPKGRPIFLGYVTQQHNIRKNSSGMTKGWSIFGERIHNSVKKNIINKLSPLNQVYNWGPTGSNLGKIPNLHSLMPYSLEARKPVFDCKYSDGLRGDHTVKAKDSIKHFKSIVNRLTKII